MSSTHVLAGRSGKSTRGFTLVELLVVLLIMSVLVAVVIPVVSQQSNAADVPRVATDLTGLRDAIGLFNANVRKMPGDIEDLANLIVAGGTDKNLFNANFTTAERNRWNGPYTEAVVPAATGFQAAAFGTALNGEVLNGIVCFNADRNTDTVSIAPNLCAAQLSNDSSLFAAIRIVGIDSVDFRRINELIDGTSETTPRRQGRLRHGLFGTNDTIFYLAVPVPK
jgi:prepilin-type N-terminal cleavage/methylation domain-containing protein